MGSTPGVRPKSTNVSWEKHAGREQTREVSGPYTVVNTTVTLSSAEAPHFYDFTDVVKALVEQSGIRTGTALVFSKHTTAAIAVIEHEPLLLNDIAEMLQRLIPHSSRHRYRHDDFSVRTVNMTDDEHKNGHAHCQHLFMGASCHLPIIERSLELGQWQRIFLVELDSPRSRQVVVLVSGVAEQP
ncbi:MAG TPA: secondary thiamine-phosphate synthase enzyme YjbQ [Ktedonobacteraceae bacterium]